MSSSGASRVVGISQRIRLEWMDHAAELAQSGQDRAQVSAALTEMLRDKVSVGGTAARSNREKTITILTRIWCNPPTRLVSLRDAGLQLLVGATPDGEPELVRRMEPVSRFAVHWGMTMAVYPFWNSVATQVGRLLRLQGGATAAQINRRVQERYGERPTVARATQRVIRSFVDWGALADTKALGRYAPTEARPVADRKLVAWLAEAALHVRDGTAASPTDLLHQPGLFPFRVSYVPPHALGAASSRLEVVRHGLDTELLILRSAPVHALS